MITIRMATKNDIDLIQKFLKETWNENHIFVHDRSFFEWQHLRGDEFHFIIGIDEETKQIYGVEGFIPMNQEEHPDISGAIWKTIKSERPLLGVELRKELEKLTGRRMMCSPGLNPKTSGQLIRLLGEEVGVMPHYYRLFPKEEYHIAKVSSIHRIPVKHSDCVLQPISTIEELSSYVSSDVLKEKKPYKDLAYLQHRYFEHPIYHYQVYGIVKKIAKNFFQKEDMYMKQCGVLIMREVNVSDADASVVAKACKIVDYLGDDRCLCEIGEALDHLMEQNQYEYTDLYCYGIEPSILTQAGFCKRNTEDDCIIPNYFEPFERRNVDIYFSSTDLDGLHLYRGDGDQDRPNDSKERKA